MLIALRAHLREWHVAFRKWQVLIERSLTVHVPAVGALLLSYVISTPSTSLQLYVSELIAVESSSSQWWCASLRPGGPGRCMGRDCYPARNKSSCTGCECFRDSGDFTTKRSPFPRWHTDSSIADDPNQRQNFSVTATAEFLSLWRKSASCYLHITHLPRSPPAHPVIRAPSPTRVRVDSLVSEHRGVYGYARKVLMFPRSYPAGIQRARSLLDPARGCLEDCTGGRWPCPKPNASHVHNKSSSG